MERRKFLQIAGLSAVAASPLAIASDNTANKDIHFDESYDLVVVGSGFAGNAAALQATELGLKVLLIEKMPAFGGNSSINGGGMAVVNSLPQKEKGISDSVELFKQDLLKAGRGLGIPELCQVVAAGSHDAYNWLVHHGVQFEETPFHYGGHSVPRVLLGKHITGSAINEPMRKAARAKGATYLNNCPLRSFLLNEKDEVVGVTVEKNKMWDMAIPGQVKNIQARFGVIMASGGYSNDISFRMLQEPSLSENVESTNQPGATAESLKMMIRLGGAPRHLSWIQLGPWTSPDERGYGDASDYTTYASFVHGIVVDVRSGKRIMNELADRKTRCDAIMSNVDANGKPVYPVAICDIRGNQDKGLSPVRVKRIIKNGVVREFQTLEDFAKGYGIPVYAFKQQVEEYNQYVKQAKDGQFGKPVTDIKPIDTPPYYGCRLWPKVHYTMGGIAINEHAEVISMDNKPIKGLYACGEVASGVFGASRLGAASITDCVVMGRVAAQSVNKLKVG